MKYCKCNSDLILANLEEGRGKCPICKLPKKLNKRLKGMSKMFTKNENKIQCAKCQIPKYRHSYFEDCGHDFLNEDYYNKQHEDNN